jgi:hypothetical protein
MAKTYIPKLVALIATIVKYVGRWQDPIKEHLTPEQGALLDELLTAANALLTAINLVEAL